MKAQALTQVGFTLTFPPHTLYSLPVHSVGTQGRWVPLGDILAIIKQHKLQVFRGLSQFHPKNFTFYLPPHPLYNIFFLLKAKHHQI